MNHQIRTVVFGSLYGGFNLLKHLSSDKFSERFKITGVATDDPSKPFTHPDIRLWRYPHTRQEEFLVREYAADLGLPVYTGKVSSCPFVRVFQSEWRPELCLMATFGQKIPRQLYKYPRVGFYNFHHSAETWPSYPGPNPIEQMVEDGRSHLTLTMHKVSNTIDGGEFVARSQRISIPKGVDALEMHRVSWPQTESFLSAQIQRLLKSYKGPRIVMPFYHPELQIETDLPYPYFVWNGS